MVPYRYKLFIVYQKVYYADLQDNHLFFLENMESRHDDEEYETNSNHETHADVHSSDGCDLNTAGKRKNKEIA